MAGFSARICWAASCELEKGINRNVGMAVGTKTRWRVEYVDIHLSLRASVLGNNGGVLCVVCGQAAQRIKLSDRAKTEIRIMKSQKRETRKGRPVRLKRVVSRRPKLPLSLFDSYAVWLKVWEQHPLTKIKPGQVADVLDAVVAIERKAAKAANGEVRRGGPDR